MTETPFGKLRVIEVASGVGGAWAAKLFADLGADVVRIEGADDLVRDRPDDLHVWLNTNKRVARESELALLADGADLVIHELDVDEADLLGVGHDLLVRRPDVVVLALTPFGQTGPYAGYRATELNIMHASSWGNVAPADAVDPELPPLKAPGHHATINVSTMAAAAALSAVFSSQRTGRGDHLDFSMFAAAAKVTEFAPAAVSFLGAEVTRLGRRTVTPWGIFACDDGLMQVIVPEQEQWESLVNLMGEPEWAVMEVFATAADRSANSDLLNIYFSEWMASQSVDQLYVDAQAARVAMTPVNTMAQLDANAHMASRGFFAISPAGMKLPGPGFQFDQPWWGLRTDAPVPSAEVAGWMSKREERPPRPSERSAKRPLEGVRVCDFTWVWAGPFCTQLLAHLGADVVRLESADRSCMFRRLPFMPTGFEGHLDASGSFQIYNSDKRSLGIDLRHPDSAEVVRRLVASSDVVIDNFGVGTMADLGYGVDDLRKINPDVIVASLSGYGQSGPSSGYMAYGPAGGSMAGLYAANGYGDGKVWETGVAIGDPGTGITAAWSVVAALFARQQGGPAAAIDVAMVEAVATTVGEGWMNYLANGQSPEPIGNHDLQWAPHNCYPAAGEDQWITIACISDDEWRGLADVLASEGVVLDVDLFQTAASRKAHEIVLDEALAAFTARHDKWELTFRLQEIGIRAFPSLAPQELWTGDAQLEALGMVERPDHPVTGTFVVPGVPWSSSTGQNGLRRPSPMLGEHTNDVLTELGFQSDEIADLLTRSVVSQSPRSSRRSQRS